MLLRPGENKSVEAEGYPRVRWTPTPAGPPTFTESCYEPPPVGRMLLNNPEKVRSQPKPQLAQSEVSGHVRRSLRHLKRLFLKTELGFTHVNNRTVIVPNEGIKLEVD